MKLLAASMQDSMLSSISSLSGVLDQSERSAGARIDSERDRRRFVASSILKRYLLSASCDWQVDPHDWVFEQGCEGKPVLSGKFYHLKLQFNVSHCDGLFVIAVQRQTPIGIHVESSGAAIGQVAARAIFTERELACLDYSGQPTQQLKLWTLKAAYLKFLGVGLRKDPLDFDISALVASCTQPSRSGSPQFSLSSWTMGVSGASYTLSVAAFEQFQYGSEVESRCFTSADELHASLGRTLKLSRELMG